MSAERLLFIDSVVTAEEKQANYKDKKKTCSDCEKEVRNKETILVTDYDVIYCKDCWQSYPKPKGDSNL